MVLGCIASSWERFRKQIDQPGRHLLFQSSGYFQTYSCTGLLEWPVHACWGHHGFDLASWTSWWHLLIAMTFPMLYVYEVASLSVVACRKSNDAVRFKDDLVVSVCRKMTWCLWLRWWSTRTSWLVTEMVKHQDQLVGVIHIHCHWSPLSLMPRNFDLNPGLPRGSPTS